MKRNTPHTPTPTSEHHSENLNDWTKGDPVWDILEQASTCEPDAFFARNVVRSARQLEPTSVRSRIINLFTSRRLALGAATCACVMIGYQVWPATDTKTTNPSPVVAHTDQSTPLSTDLSELVIEETLLAAADDPTIFTRDEVVSMLGL